MQEALLNAVQGYMYPNEMELQWSILIVLYPYITGLVAGAFILASLATVLGYAVRTRRSLADPLVALNGAIAAISDGNLASIKFIAAGHIGEITGHFPDHALHLSIKRNGTPHHIVKDRCDLLSKMEIGHVFDLIAKNLVFWRHWNHLFQL